MKRSALCFAAIIACSALPLRGSACTYFAVSTRAGEHMIGRSLEFGTESDGSPLKTAFKTVPRGQSHTSRTDEGVKPVTWTNRLGYFGPVHGEGTIFSEGMNEKGVSIAALWLNDGVYPKPVSDTVNLSNADVVEWILGQFDSAKAAVDALEGVHVSQHMTSLGIPLPLHWSVADKTGASYVVEYIDGKLIVTDNSDLRVMTNSPRIEWQRRNLAEFKSDFPQLDPASDQRNPEFLSGLPGSVSSPARFLRVAIQRDLCGDVKDLPAALNTALHLLNSVDYVPGVPFVEGRGVSSGAQQTPWITVIDPHNLHYYFRTQDSMNVHKVDLTRLDFSEGARTTSFNPYGGSTFIDVTAEAMDK